jgi:hypothetical protein
MIANAENGMSPSGTTIGVRLDFTLLGQLDDYVAILTNRTGLKVTRAAAARRLLEIGLQHEQSNIARTVDRKAATKSPNSRASRR